MFTLGTNLPNLLLRQSGEYTTSSSGGAEEER